MTYRLAAHQIQQAIDTVWGDLPASDRRLIHIHTCLHADSTTDEVMRRFLELVTEQAGGGDASPTATE